jgi:hypothetical protein
MSFKCLVTCALVLLTAQLALSQDATPSTPTVPSLTSTPSGYSGLLETEIRGLTPETIAGYRTGKGMSLALPAELNGYPGPRHVLDFSEELALTDEQYAEVETLYNNMLGEAIPLGEQILAAETALELAFREHTITDESLEAQLLTIGTLEAELRFVHLKIHIATYALLTPEQVKTYNVLRGYASEEEDTHQGHGAHS